MKRVVVLFGALFLAGHPPLAVRGAAAGAGAAVAAVAAQAALSLVPGSWKRVGTARSARTRWICYALAGGTAAALVGPGLVLVMIGTGLLEVAIRTGRTATRTTRGAAPLPPICGRAVLGRHVERRAPQVFRSIH